MTPPDKQVLARFRQVRRAIRHFFRGYLPTHHILKKIDEQKKNGRNSVRIFESSLPRFVEYKLYKMGYEVHKCYFIGDYYYVILW